MDGDIDQFIEEFLRYTWQQNTNSKEQIANSKEKKEEGK
jgi:hypothetical protein